MEPRQLVPWWRRIFHWPLFAVLAAVHILALPLLFSEPKDDVVAMIGGLFYLALAVMDRRQYHVPVRPIRPIRSRF